MRIHRLRLDGPGQTLASYFANSDDAKKSGGPEWVRLADVPAIYKTITGIVDLSDAS
jgi:hypothetical protein